MQSVNITKEEQNVLIVAHKTFGAPAGVAKKLKRRCKQCGSVDYCDHNKRKEYCREHGGSALCLHDKIKYRCKQCQGSGICLHNKEKSRCIQCQGTETCEHLKIKKSCHICKPIDALQNVIRSHIESQFKEGMSWDNYGEWHIDHKIPLKYQNPSFDQIIERLLWTNTQPLWAKENWYITK